jgi:hypothetical protein
MAKQRLRIEMAVCLARFHWSSTREMYFMPSEIIHVVVESEVDVDVVAQAREALPRLLPNPEDGFRDSHHYDTEGSGTRRAAKRLEIFKQQVCNNLFDDPVQYSYSRWNAAFGRLDAIPSTCALIAEQASR